MPKHQHHQMWIINCIPKCSAQIWRLKHVTSHLMWGIFFPSLNQWADDMKKPILNQVTFLNSLFALKFHVFAQYCGNKISDLAYNLQRQWSCLELSPFTAKEALEEVWSRISLDICAISEKEKFTVVYNTFFPEGLRALDVHWVKVISKPYVKVLNR